CMYPSTYGGIEGKPNTRLKLELGIERLKFAILSVFGKQQIKENLEAKLLLLSVQMVSEATRTGNGICDHFKTSEQGIWRGSQLTAKRNRRLVVFSNSGNGHKGCKAQQIVFSTPLDQILGT
ncbi:unnamed protein product, partial [Dovyalis caffra]